MKKYRLTVLQEKILKKGKRYFTRVRCYCGTEKNINQDDFRAGKIKSCGCLSKETSSKTIKKFNKNARKRDRGGYKHGDSNTRFWRAFRSMRNRCLNKRNKKYYRYGKRGIKIEWASYQDFKRDMHDGYKKHLKKYGKKNTSIDRIDNNGNYSKENCRWSTNKEQSNNTRRNRFFTYEGKRMSVSQWAEKLDIKRSTLSGRINKQKLSFLKAIRLN